MIRGCCKSYLCPQEYGVGLDIKEDSSVLNHNNILICDSIQTTFIDKTFLMRNLLNSRSNAYELLTIRSVIKISGFVFIVTKIIIVINNARKFVTFFVTHG